MKTLENDYSMSLGETLELIDAIPASDKDLIPYYQNKYDKVIKECGLDIINKCGIDWMKIKSKAQLVAVLNQAVSLSEKNREQVTDDLATEIADRLFIEERKG